ncbi:hypothetical protein NIES267_24370 [Calothrix parasitica NIES-267]|uniref:Uncharacterized protein n=1 Tax=Calothrix parasitica NIES-267 TaxID=1973488 RepID=A0A1Z4LP05_9CYAN|nr:hypothetical protein NIES267_24370 [Calothrix parasitica NIES-267]
MTTQPDYSKIYTHAPEQHPNLILGSLQFLFWVFFRPTAFKNHLKRIHPILDTDISLITALKRESDILENPALRKFFVQGFFILPILLGVILCVAIYIYNWVLDGIVVSLRAEVALVLASCLLLGLLYTIGSNIVFTLIYATVLLLLARTPVVSLFFIIGVIIASWRPNIFHPLLIPWNSFLYSLEQIRTSRKLSLLRFHPAFWNEHSESNGTKKSRNTCGLSCLQFSA